MCKHSPTSSRTINGNIQNKTSTIKNRYKKKEKEREEKEKKKKKKKRKRKRKTKKNTYERLKSWCFGPN